MKTGRLLKFQRTAAEIHAYLYREGSVFCAAVYVMSHETGRQNQPVQSLTGSSEQEVEDATRSWIESRYPRN
ncbi:MAG: hypothetical protein ACHQNV_05055 [Vicinamibacteria bacterium]